MLHYVAWHNNPVIALQEDRYGRRVRDYVGRDEAMEALLEGHHFLKKPDDSYNRVPTGGPDKRKSASKEMSTSTRK